MVMLELQAIHLMLTKWKANPELPRKEVSVFSGDKSGREADMPFTKQEITRMKERLRERAPTSYYQLFPEERL